MSLATCRECNQEVSSNAASCPRCGAPHPAMSGTDLVLFEQAQAARADALSHSYIGPAFASLVWYPILILPGLITNILFLREARRMEEIAGRPLPGTGCLWALLLLGPILAYVYYVLFSVYNIVGGLLQWVQELF